MNPRGCGGANPCRWYLPFPSIPPKPGLCSHPGLEAWYRKHRPQDVIRGVRMTRPADQCRARGGYCDVRGRHWQERPKWEPYHVR